MLTVTLGRFMDKNCNIIVGQNLATLLQLVQILILIIKLLSIKFQNVEKKKI